MIFERCMSRFGGCVAKYHVAKYCVASYCVANCLLQNWFDEMDSYGRVTGCSKRLQFE